MKYSEPIPKGFTIQPISPNAMIIHYQRSIMTATNIGLGLWILPWTIVCIRLLYILILQINAQLPKDISPVPLLIVVEFWAADIFVIYLFINSIFCEKSFNLNHATITIHTKLFRWQWQKQIIKTSIKQFKQIRDNGNVRSVFSSWGLKLEGTTPTIILSRQPYEKSYWLGQVLADWAKVPFIPDTRKRSRR